MCGSRRRTGKRRLGGGEREADLTTGRAITSKTVFDMASNSKQFTADAVLLLAGRHRLALDDPLSAFLDDPPAWTRKVTLGDMMRHTSGITDYQDLLEAKGIELTDPAGQKEAIEAILASQPEDPPGRRFSNSNSNYVLLALSSRGSPASCSRPSSNRNSSLRCTCA
ncbi:serine hydrolase domain-containing protein [Streptomyces sp. NRRL F-2580]|uniref:serine hydrolase domain-containing protein n=1 Tax=Streptomyces sp. NRRL F-2580 TaxID=1463841 RepID=UPI001F217215|nr:serine hydrolase domain-containing protein [Streptomyces sp. NRRL F-2580]